MKWGRRLWTPQSVASLCSPPGFGSQRSGSADGRWTLVWHVVFSVMLLGFTAAVLASRPGAVVSAVCVGLAALLAGWYACWIVLRPDLVVRSTAWRTTYFTVGSVLWFSLVTLSPNYANLGVVALGQLFAYLRPRWALPGALVVLLLWLAGFGLDGSLATAGTLRWQGVSWPVVAGTTLVVALLALCFYSFRELSSTRSELAAAERQAGILGERQRIAGDIHDTLTQGLASIVMLLEAAQAAYQAGQPEAGRRIEEAARTAREGLQDVRRLVWDLRPEALERGTLEEALARLTAQLEEQTGMAAQMVVTGEAGAIAPQVEVTLLRVAQEALANVRRHAHAREVTITLSYMEDEVALDVQDDGRGFHPAMLIGASPGGGLGLTAMRERVESLGGTLTVESTPGEGATVVAQLPSQMPTLPSIPALSRAGGHRR
jgi:signal transduction histidine kinase